MEQHTLNTAKSSVAPDFSGAPLPGVAESMRTLGVRLTDVRNRKLEFTPRRPAESSRCNIVFLTFTGIYDPPRNFFVSARYVQPALQRCS
jgi:hypothetical protein